MIIIWCILILLLLRLSIFELDSYPPIFMVKSHIKSHFQSDLIRNNSDCRQLKRTVGYINSVPDSKIGRNLQNYCDYLRSHFFCNFEIPLLCLTLPRTLSTYIIIPLDLVILEVPFKSRTC